MIRDLGTLGGPEAGATAVNERGQVVGWAATVEGDRNRCSYHAFLWQNGTMRDLGVLPGSRQSEARGINDRGQVVGWSGHSREGGGCGEASSSSLAFLWEKGTMRRLGALPGGKRGSRASAINNVGQVVGESWTKHGTWHAVLWQKGRVQDLGTLGGKESYAVDVNDRGQVVGGSTTKSGAWHAFLWQKGKMRDLGTALAWPTGINAHGDVVGSSYLWRDGKLRDLGTLGGEESGAADINDRGQVVGRSTIEVGKAMIHAFLWQNGTMLDLSTPGLWTAAQAISERGQSVGSAKPSGTERAVLWTYRR